MKPVKVHLRDHDWERLREIAYQLDTTVSDVLQRLAARHAPGLEWELRQQRLRATDRPRLQLVGE